ncbi:unnamed protein product [Lactuca saligna]|uniref:phosphoribosylformylglycinamidine cyclo-ligase n=1 Tax=Lactuca saligna TaxID=75948 RepID=A0AA36DYD3_LACSI|nr:unnamed protein product [Lactuca saligna]
MHHHSSRLTPKLHLVLQGFNTVQPCAESLLLLRTLRSLCSALALSSSITPQSKASFWHHEHHNIWIKSRDIQKTYKKWSFMIAKMAPGIGGFGGLFPLGDSYLVAGTDGVGTKLKLAFETGIHDSIGIDLVAMSVNDIITSGAKPLFFLDYYATSRLDVDLAEKVIKGIVDGCQQSDCALLGGETAEMPDFYAEGEYDLSGFAVGIVKKESVINGKNIEVGDVLIGLPSSGVHSNGFSLVRRVLARSGLSLKDKLPGEESVTLAEALMAPTVIYVKQVLDIISKEGSKGIKGIAHITGGGFTDNIPRVFPKGLGALVYNNSWPVPPVFKWIQKAGGIEDGEMKRTFNMGIGMVLVVSKEAAERVLKEGGMVYRIGEVISGDGVSYQ